jgi:hypothetical protein
VTGHLSFGFKKLRALRPYGIDYPDAA